MDSVDKWWTRARSLALFAAGFLLGGAWMLRTFGLLGAIAIVFGVAFGIFSIVAFIQEKRAAAAPSGPRLFEPTISQQPAPIPIAQEIESGFQQANGDVPDWKVAFPLMRVADADSIALHAKTESGKPEQLRWGFVIPAPIATFGQKIAALVSQPKNNRTN
jgi:hypothetical protein